MRLGDGSKRNTVRRRERDSPCMTARHRVAVVAAAICALFATLLVAQAAGLDLWGVIVQWSEETFRFTYQSNDTSSSWMEGSQELEDMELGEYLPTWIPEGYDVEEIETYESQGQSTAIVTFSGEDLPAFCLFVDVYEDLEQMQYTIFEKDDTPVQERRLSNGAMVYLYENGGDEASVYQHQNVIVSISGRISRETEIKIYESIGEGT